MSYIPERNRMANENAQIAKKLMLLAKTGKELSEIMKCSFNLRVAVAPEAYGYPEGTTSATLTVPPHYEYVLCNDGTEIFRYKHGDITPEEFSPGKAPEWK